MKCFVLAAALALAGCAGQRDGETISIYVPPPQQHELRPEYGGPVAQPQTNTLGYLLGSFALGASYGYATRYDHHSHHDHDRRPLPADAPRGVVQPPVLMEAPIRCRPGIGGRGAICN